MHFEITHGVKAGKQLTAAQRNSSLFSEEPRIGAQTLRRGSPPLKLSREQVVTLASQLKRLFLAGAIEITGFDDGRKMSLREDLAKMAAGMGMSVPAVLDKVFGELSGHDSGLGRPPPPKDPEGGKNEPPQDPPKTELPPENPPAPDMSSSEPVVEVAPPVVQAAPEAATVAPVSAPITATTEPVSEKKKGRK